MPRLLQWRTSLARCFLLLTMLESKESSRISDSRRYFPNTDRGLQVLLKCLPLPAVGIDKTSGSLLAIRYVRGLYLFKCTFPCSLQIAVSNTADLRSQSARHRLSVSHRLSLGDCGTVSHQSTPRSWVLL
jgi:hypothetical protein